MAKSPYPVLVFLLALALPSSALDILGSGRLRTEVRQASGFQAVEMEAVGYLRLSQGKAWSLKLTLDDNLQDFYEARVSAGVLHLGFRPGSTVRNPTRLVVDLTLPVLEKLSLSGACEAELDGGFVGTSLDLTVSGAGKIAGRLEYRTLSLGLSGSGRLVLAGSAGDLSVRAGGAGEIDTAGLRALRVKAELYGATRLVVRAVESLDLVAAGASDVVYLGDPRVAKKLTGTSRLRRLGP